VLDRQLNPPTQNVTWAGYITCIPTRHGCLYLAVAVELHVRWVGD
jgi:hypothetical protein